MSNFLVGTNLADVALDKFNGDTSTVAFTLSVPSSTFSALVRISGVVQTPVDDFNISGTAITFTSAPPIGTDNIVVTYTKAAQVGVPNDASVSADKLASNAVTTAKILDANVTLAKMASGTDGNIISYDASGNPVAIATGTDGQVLTSAGAGAQPAFETLPAASQDVVLLQTVEASSSATVSLTSFDNSTYNNYLVVIDAIPVTDSVGLQAKFSTDGGSSYITADYDYGRIFRENTTVYGQQGFSQSIINCSAFTVANFTATGGWVGTMELFNCASTSVGTGYNVIGGCYRNGATTYNGTEWGVHGVAQDTDAIQFLFSSGNIASGTFKLYGRK